MARAAGGGGDGDVELPPGQRISAPRSARREQRGPSLGSPEHPRSLAVNAKKPSDGGGERETGGRGRGGINKKQRKKKRGGWKTFFSFFLSPPQSFPSRCSGGGAHGASGWAARGWRGLAFGGGRGRGGPRTARPPRAPADPRRAAAGRDRAASGLPRTAPRPNNRRALPLAAAAVASPLTGPAAEPRVIARRGRGAAGSRVPRMRRRRRSPARRPPSALPGAGAVAGACPRSRRRARPPVRANKAPAGRGSPGGKAPAAPRGLLLCLGPRHLLGRLRARPRRPPRGVVPRPRARVRTAALSRAKGSRNGPSPRLGQVLALSGRWLPGNARNRGVWAESECLTQKRESLPSCLSDAHK